MVQCNGYPNRSEVIFRLWGIHSTADDEEQQTVIKAAAAAPPASLSSSTEEKKQEAVREKEKRLWFRSQTGNGHGDIVSTSRWLRSSTRGRLGEWRYPAQSRAVFQPKELTQPPSDPGEGSSVSAADSFSIQKPSGREAIRYDDGAAAGDSASGDRICLSADDDRARFPSDSRPPFALPPLSLQ